MNEWILLILFSVVGSVLSLAGGVYLLLNKKGSQLLQRIAVPFSAGALLAASFFDLLPEAISDSGARVVTWALIGFLTFFLLERAFHWFHHHHNHDPAEYQSGKYLIIIGDTLHNFFDGLAIGAAFLVSPSVGILTSMVIAAHEIPQEIGDFGFLLDKGMSRRRILLVNLISAMSTVLAAVLVFGLGHNLNLPVGAMLAATAGFFIYIAASDIVPAIHQKTDVRQANIETLILLLAVVLVGVITVKVDSFIEDQTALTSETRP